MRTFIVALSMLLTLPALAQQNQCRTSPVGASTAYCASEAFVTKTAAAAPQGTVTGVNGAGVAASSGGAPTPTITVTAASKSDEQAGTSAVLVTTPSQQQQHDSAVKAWVSFNGTTGSILAQYNVASISRGSTGHYTVTFTTAFANTNYACSYMGLAATGSNGTYGILTSVSVGSLALHAISAASADSDSTQAMLQCFGRQ